MYSDRAKELLRERKRIMEYRWNHLNQDMDEDTECRFAIDDIDHELMTKHNIRYPADASRELYEQESKA